VLRHALKHAKTTSSNIVDNSVAYDPVTFRSALLHSNLTS